VIAALRLEGLDAPAGFDGAIDSASFLAYIQQVLVPTLRPGDVGGPRLMAAHKQLDVRAAIEQACAYLRFLPPYSSDFNPIELAFAKLKVFLRRGRAPSSKSASSSRPRSACSLQTNAHIADGTAAIVLLRPTGKTL
jgi:transposase